MDELDLDELKTMFLEECREHVDTLERGLLEMAEAEHSSELLNEVFRLSLSSVTRASNSFRFFLNFLLLFVVLWYG